MDSHSADSPFINTPIIGHDELKVLVNRGVENIVQVFPEYLTQLIIINNNSLWSGLETGECEAQLEREVWRWALMVVFYVAREEHNYEITINDNQLIDSILEALTNNNEHATYLQALLVQIKLVQYSSITFIEFYVMLCNSNSELGNYDFDKLIAQAVIIFSYNDQLSDQVSKSLQRIKYGLALSRKIDECDKTLGLETRSQEYLSKTIKILIDCVSGVLGASTFDELYRIIQEFSISKQNDDVKVIFKNMENDNVLREWTLTVMLYTLDEEMDTQIGNIDQDSFSNALLESGNTSIDATEKKILQELRKIWPFKGKNILSAVEVAGLFRSALKKINTEEINKQYFEKILNNNSTAISSLLVKLGVNNEAFKRGVIRSLTLNSS